MVDLKEMVNDMMGRDSLHTAEEVITAVLEDKAKDIATEFYYYWHNSGGTNTVFGFDEWWSLNKKRFGVHHD